MSVQATKMRVLNVNVMLDPVFGGGTAERTFQMSKALVKAGVDCTVLTTDLGLSEARLKSLKGVRVVALHCLLKRYFIVRFSWSELKNLVAEADVIHLMGQWSLMNVLIYVLARKLNKPYVICPAGELNLFGRSIRIKKIFNYFIGSQIVKNAASHIAVTADEISIYETYGVPANEVAVIPNGINEDDFIAGKNFSFAAHFGLGEHPFALFMGRLNLIKGPDLLLSAFHKISRQYPDYHLVYAGPDGGLLEQLQASAKELNLSDRVHFVGYLGGDKKVSAYKEADFLVIPSRHEAMSIVVLESGICDTPVLLTDRCGFDEVEKIGGGKIVPATVDALATGLSSMMNQRQSLAEMGTHLGAFVRTNFSWDLICQRYLHLYRQIILHNTESKKI